MTLDVTVITPTITTRLDQLLPKAIASVEEQTHHPAAHLIGVDYKRVGGAAIRNQLWKTALTEYIAVLDDDDVFYPNHLAKLVETADSTDADIVYTYCHVFGRPGWNPNSMFNRERLKHENFIPSAALYRYASLKALHGWRDPVASRNGWPDYDLFYRATFDHDMSIVTNPVVTWAYVFHGGNSTMVPGGEPEAT